MNCIPVSVFSLECLLYVSRNAVLANNSGISTSCWSLEGRVLALRAILLIAVGWFFPFPNWRKVSLTLCALKRLWRRWNSRFLGDEIYHVFQSYQVDEFRIRGTRHKVHLWWWRFRRWYLQERLFQLLPKSLLSSSLALCGSLTVISRRSILQYDEYVISNWNEATQATYSRYQRSAK